MRCDAHRAARQEKALQPRGPGGRVVLYAQVECWLQRMRRRDLPRDHLAVIFDPALTQPLRRVDQGIERGNLVFAFASDPPQHGIDEGCVVPRGAVLAGDFNGSVDGGMIGDRKKKNWRGADQENDFHERRFLRKAAFQQGSEQRAQAAEPAQGFCHEHVDKSAVAIGKRAEASNPGFGVEDLIERAMAMQDRLKRLGRGAAGSKTRGVRSGRRRRVAHAGHSATLLVPGALKPVIVFSAAYHRSANMGYEQSSRKRTPAARAAGGLTLRRPECWK